MHSQPSEAVGENSVSYDGPALLETSFEETDFRLDVGKQGSALCISTRPSGAWDWTFGGEARWDGSQLRSRAFDRNILLQLAAELKTALAALE